MGTMRVQPNDTSPNTKTDNLASDDRNSPNYLLEYGFLQAPFTTQIDDNLYYEDPGQKQRLDLILHLTQFSEDMLILTGASGSGKTTLAYQFMQHAHASWHTCMIAASKTLSSLHLLRQISHSYQIQSESQILEQLIQEVQGHLSDLLSESGPYILIVDDAHLLNSDTLGVLLELANTRDASEKKQLHILLLAQPEIKARLLEPEVAPSRYTKIRKLEIPALNDFHADAMLHFRLRVSGCNERIIPDKILNRMLREAGGNPGKLCEAAHEYLSKQVASKLEKQASDENSSSVADWFKRVGLVVIALIGIALIFFQSTINRFFDGHAQKPSHTVQQKIALPPPPPSKEAASGENSDSVLADNTRFDHLNDKQTDSIEDKRHAALEKIQTQLKKLERKRKENPGSSLPVG